MQFPKRIYTLDEFMKARKSLKAGHKHRLKVVGSPCFKKKVEHSLKLITKANYYEFLRTYIRQLSEVEGVSQLRETEATIWLNNYVIGNPVEGARFIIQKTYQMKYYLEGKEYYRKGEMPAIKASIAFLDRLQDQLIDETERNLCEEAIAKWTEEWIL